MNFKSPSHAALQGHFHTINQEPQGETLVLPGNVFLFGDSDYILYYLAVDSGTRRSDPMVRSDKGLSSAFNMRGRRLLFSFRPTSEPDFRGTQSPDPAELSRMSGERFTQKEGDTAILLFPSLPRPSALSLLPLPLVPWTLCSLHNRWKQNVPYRQNPSVYYITST